MSATAKTAALLIKPFPYNLGISDVSVGLNNTRNRDFVKFKVEMSILIQNLTIVPIKLEKKLKILNFIVSFFLLNIRSRQLCYGCMETTLYYKILFPHLQKTVDPVKKNDCCHGA